MPCFYIIKYTISLHIYYINTIMIRLPSLISNYIFVHMLMIDLQRLYHPNIESGCGQRQVVCSRVHMCVCLWLHVFVTGLYYDSCYAVHTQITSSWYSRFNFICTHRTEAHFRTLLSYQ